MQHTFNEPVFATNGLHSDKRHLATGTSMTGVSPRSARHDTPTRLRTMRTVRRAPRLTGCFNGNMRASCHGARHVPLKRFGSFRMRQHVILGHRIRPGLACCSIKITHQVSAPVVIRRLCVTTCVRSARVFIGWRRPLCWGSPIAITSTRPSQCCILPVVIPFEQTQRWWANSRR